MMCRAPRPIRLGGPDTTNTVSSVAPSTTRIDLCALWCVGRPQLLHYVWFMGHGEAIYLF